jgi:hypothetical protein
MRSTLITAAVAGALLAAGISAASPASAMPGKSPNWIQLVGECNGVPTVLTDPPGPGPTAFNLANGRVGVGRLFENVYAPTGQVIESQEYGSALEHANRPIFTCNFPVPPEFSPDGTADWIFRVTGFMP